MPRKPQFRALFVSDLHLGTKGCQAELFLDFLRHHEAETIYLVGDIVDGWRLQTTWYWPELHNTIVQKLLRKARKGTKIVYVPGNHDEFARAYHGMVFGGIRIAGDAVHVTADGRRFYVTHGDEYDIVVRHARWLARLGDWAYVVALGANTRVNGLRRWFGLPYWSFSAWAKLRIKNAVNFIGSFEETLAKRAAQHAFDGIICGHIHHATIRDLQGVTYINIGDFVESCTAVIEHFDGRLELVRWQSLGPNPEFDVAEPGLDLPFPEFA